jgi:hypothetical protein
MSAKAADKKQQIKMYADTENCFGKVNDDSEAECQKCLDKESCQEWQSAGGDPAEKSKPAATNKPTPKGTTKEEAPVKKEDLKKAAAPVKKEEPKKAAPAKKDGEKKANPFAGNKDENGFKEGSKSGRFFALIKEGNHTTEKIVSMTAKEFDADEKTNASTFKLFCGDVQKPTGTYSASRGLTIVTGDKGILSFDEPKAAKKK